MSRALMFAVVLLSAGPALAQAPTAPAAAETQAARFERDRQSILAQAGQHHVRFDMRENVSFRDGYTPIEEKIAAGEEIVRVVHDQGDRISLQHILVLTDDNGVTMVVKHWRQDWVYQPATVLTYAGPNRWTLTAVGTDQRQGAWSQTVWQTDDSPRYGGVGRWTYDNGVAAWTSGPTWRPLARRDAIRHPIYDRYLGTNRHALTPHGWVHIQDNMKMGAAAQRGEVTAIVQEDVINTYRRVDNYDPKPGDDYWAKTRDYWAAVRAQWDRVIVQNRGVHLQEAANQGAVTGGPLMDWADQIAEGEMTTEAAIAEARALIVQATTEPGGA